MNGNKIICYFSGWAEQDADDVLLIDPHGDSPAKSAAQWITEKGNIDGLILDSFNEFNKYATDGEFEELRLEIQKEDS